MKRTNLLTQFSLMAALGLTIFISANIGLSYRAESTSQLEKLWEQDLSNLKAAQKLPIYWGKIRVVEKISGNGDKNAEHWKNKISSPIQINPNGQYKLEILFLSQSEATSEKAVIQHHIIHLPTGNSVWELGRTYDLKKETLF